VFTTLPKIKDTETVTYLWPVLYCVVTAAAAEYVQIRVAVLVLDGEHLVPTSAQQWFRQGAVLPGPADRGYSNEHTYPKGASNKN
jgi:hypothetical protein